MTRLSQSVVFLPDLLNRPRIKYEVRKGEKWNKDENACSAQSKRERLK